MSYFLEDDNGYLGDVATGKGLHDLYEWFLSVANELLKDFVRDGMSGDPAALAETIASVVAVEHPQPTVLATARNLVVLLRKSTGAVVITDGITEET